MFLHGYLLACEISTVRTQTLNNGTGVKKSLVLEPGTIKISIRASIYNFIPQASKKYAVQDYIS